MLPAGETCPAGHWEHRVLPVVVATCPARHGSHTPFVPAEPAGQGSQASWLAFGCSPSPHVMVHTAVPSSGAYVLPIQRWHASLPLPNSPAGHLVHAALPSPVASSPAEHGVQFLVLSLENVCSGQLKHLSCPSLSANVPAGHFEHPSPAFAANVPRGQSSHILPLLAPLPVPDRHSIHWVAPAFGACCPMGHCVHPSPAFAANVPCLHGWQLLLSG